MKKLYDELKPTILLFLTTYLLVVCLKNIDAMYVTIGVSLLFVKVLIDLTFRNNSMLKNYYFTVSILSVFLLEVVTFGIKMTFDGSNEMFGIMCLLIFASVIILLRYNNALRNNLIRKTNKQFEFLSKSYLYISYLEENNTIENFEIIKSKLSKLIYEHYYIKNNDHLEKVVEEIENALLNCDNKSAKLFIPSTKKLIKKSINDLYQGNEYKEKMYKLCCCNLDINAI